MATVNLGNIKLNWKGAYNASTAYIIDDVVSYNGSSYVCIQASTGNLPTVTTYWNQMSAKGTDGTDIGTTLTTQGDILYRDGSGLQRLGAGTSGQVLQTGGSGANPSWTNQAGGGLRFIQKSNLTSNTNEWIFDQIFANNTSYNIFKIYIYNLTHTSTSDDDIIADLRKGASGSESSFRSAHALMYHRDRRHGNVGSNNYLSTDSAGHGGFRLQHSGVDGGADNKPHYAVLTIFNPHKKDGNGNQVNMKTMMHVMTMGMTDSNGAGTHFYSGEAWGMYDNDDQVATGFSLRPSSNQLRASSGNQPMVLVFGISES